MKKILCLLALAVVACAPKTNVPVYLDPSKPLEERDRKSVV